MDIFWVLFEGVVDLDGLAVAVERTTSDWVVVLCLMLGGHVLFLAQHVLIRAVEGSSCSGGDIEFSLRMNLAA